MARKTLTLSDSGFVTYFKDGIVLRRHGELMSLSWEDLEIIQNGRSG